MKKQNEIEKHRNRLMTRWTDKNIKSQICRLRLKTNLNLKKLKKTSFLNDAINKRPTIEQTNWYNDSESIMKECFKNFWITNKMLTRRGVKKSVSQKLIIKFELLRSNLYFYYWCQLNFTPFGNFVVSIKLTFYWLITLTWIGKHQNSKC